MFFDLRKRSLHRAAEQMATARRRADGAYFREWHCAQTPDCMSSASALSSSVMDWCRETMGNARRPWGIDHFDVAIAVPNLAGSASSLTLKRVQAAELYGDELRERLDAFLRSHHHATTHSTALIAVALFSWGDAAHRALPPL